MALTSPGVQVTVIDESFYTPAEPGTTPLIVIATAENKSNAAGTGTAAGTTQANAGKVFKVSSQRELVDTFGVPFFEKTASSTPIHGSERNEYGLLAAYSFLGVSNSAFIMRADVNLDELVSQSTAPGAEPVDGAWWVDTLATSWGIQEWNGAAATTTGGQKFSVKTPLVLTDDDESKIEANAPRSSVGAIGDYAVVFQTVLGTGTYSAGRENATVWFKSAGNTYATDGGLTAPGTWVLVGSPKWKASWPTLSSTTTTALPGGILRLNGTPVTVGAAVDRATLAAAINSVCAVHGVSARAVGGGLQIYTDGEGSEAIGDSSAVAKGVLAVEGDSAVLTALDITAGEYYPPALQQTAHTNVPTWKSSSATPRPTGSVWVKTTEPNLGARWIVKRWNSATKTWVEYSAPIYPTTTAALYYLDRSGGGVNIAADSLFVQSNSNEELGQDATATFKVWKKKASGTTSVTSDVIADDEFTSANYGFTLAETLSGSSELSSYTNVTFSGTASAEGSGIVTANRLASAINAAGFVHVVAEVTASNQLKITHKAGGDIRIAAHNTYPNPIGNIFTIFGLGTGEGTPNFYESESLAATATDAYTISNWIPLATNAFNATANEPLAEPADGQLWYNTNYGEIDLLVHNGEIWVGYQDTSSPYTNTDPNGPIVAATMPTTQTDGTALVTGDLWVSTADLENFPTIYKFNPDGGAAVSQRWILVDKTDQTTEEGVLFADARYGSSGATGNTEATIQELLVSNYVDFDCPDPVLYPKGMLLWNLRRSGGNVKRYANGYIDQAAKNVRYEALYNDAGNTPVTGDGQSGYETDRWVTASPNNEDGSGSFGRKAQRALVIQKLKSAIDTSEEARDEERRNFNLIACPGYPEAMQNLIGLNLDRGMTAFVIGDSPLRLRSDSTSLLAWGTNANAALDNGDAGIVSYDEYAAVYYPNGFTTDLGGANAVVPASHMMLRTIALSDQVSYPWFAPAGTRRGGITNATAVGYIDSLTGEFQSVALNEGQRDTLYDLKVNPIPFFVGVGLVAYGQKTRARNASALDRINVARLVVYLRSQLNKLARPYIFEPNDKITRDEIRGAVESLLLELVGLRALYDFAVVCDESNNTASRIDRNELYVDIAIEPTKAVEFIYIPLRVKNTGEI